MARDLYVVLDDIGMGTYQFVQLLLLGGVMISDGAEILVSSSLLGALKEAWHLTPMVRGAMMSTIFVGVFAGGLLGGSIGDAYGRRRAVLLAYVGICVFGLATALAQGPISMLVARFFFGASFGCGMGPGIALQVETAPSSWRAHILNLGGLWFAMGEIYTSVLLILFMPDLTDPSGTHWRWVTGLSMLPGLVLFPFTWLLLQESPHFLLGQGRRTEAIQGLEYIAHMNNQGDKVEGLDGTDPALRLQLPIPGDDEDGDQSSTPAEATSSLLESENASGVDSSGLRARVVGRASKDGAGSSSLAEGSRSLVEQMMEERKSAKRITVKESMGVLFGEKYRGIVFGGAYLCFLANFLFYGLTYTLPQIFASLHHDLEPAFQVLIISMCDLPGVLFSFFLLRSTWIGHRDGLVLLSASAAVLNLTLISIDHGKYGLYVGLPSAYLAKYTASAFFTLAYVYLSEVFPAKVRSSGLSICIAAGRVGSMIAPLIVESIHKKGFELGAHAPFLILTSILCVLGIGIIKSTLHFELKNAPLQEGIEGASAASGGQEAASGSQGRRVSKKLDPDMPAPAG